MNETEAFITQLCWKPAGDVISIVVVNRDMVLRDHCDVKLERCGVGKLGHEQSCVWRVGGGGGGGDFAGPERRSVWLLI